MVKLTFLSCMIILLYSPGAISQVINNAGAAITVRGGTYVSSKDAVNGGTIRNSGNISLSGNITNNSILFGSTGTIRLEGNWLNTNIFNRDTSTVIFNGSAIQTITRAGGETFFDLSFDNTGGSAAVYIGLQNNVTVSNTLSMSRGIIKTGANRLFLSNITPGSLNYTSTTRSRILGVFERGVGLSGIYLFPLGTNTHYNPANLTTNVLPANGTVISQFFTPPPPIDSTGLPTPDDPDEVARVFSDGYWNLTAANGFAVNDFSINLRGAGFVFDTIRDITRLIKRPAGGSWIVDGTHSPASDSVVFRNNMTTGIQGGFGTQFALGQTRPWIRVQPVNDTVCERDNAQFRVIASATKDLNYYWYKVGFGLLTGPHYSQPGPGVLIIRNVTLADNGDYYCEVVDEYGYKVRTVTVKLIVNMRPIAQVANPLQPHECSNVAIDNIVLNEIRGVPGTYFLWTRDEPAGITAVGIPTSGIVGFSGGFIASGTFINTTDHYITITFTIIPYGPDPTNCDGDAVTATITVNPTPRVIPVNARPDICYGGTTDIKLTTPSVMTTGQIKFDYTVSVQTGITGTTPGATAPANDLLPDQKIVFGYNNSTDTLRSVYYSVTPKVVDLVGARVCPDGVIEIPEVKVHALPLQNITIVKQLTCEGGNDGTLRADISKGAGPYSIVWTVPFGPPKYTATITNLIGGRYDVTVTDNLGCNFSDYEMVQGAYIESYLNISSDVSCPGFSDGALSIKINSSTTGLPPYSYWIVLNYQDTIYTGSLPAKEVPVNYPGLIAGQYQLLVRDINNCPDLLPPDFPIVQPDQIRITFDSSRYSNFNVSCKGYNDGWAEAKTITGGNPGAFTYKWTALYGASFTGADNTSRINGCTAGTYRLEVWDSKGCYMIDSVKLIEPLGLALSSYQVSQSKDPLYNISCNGGNDGFIKLNVAGGSGTYNYSWTGPGGPYPNAKDLTSLREGTYIVSITDAQNASCELRLMPGSTLPQFVLQEPAPLNASIAITNAILCNGQTGTVDLVVNGGTTGKYTYNWTTSNGSGIVQGQQDQGALRAGTYNVAVTDTNGCTANANITLTEPAPLKITLAPTNITCQQPGFNNGSINATVTGGILPYTYLWQPNGATTEDLTNLTAGLYRITVTDANGCNKSDTVRILPPPSVTFDTVLSDFHGKNISCYGKSDGSIEITDVKGAPPFTYLWQGQGVNGATTSRISGIKAGTYQVLITDKNYCTASGTFTLTQPGRISADYSKSTSLDGNYNINCAGASTGTITINPVNAVGGVTYLWSDGTTDKSRTDLPAGTYQVIILDLNNCIADTVIDLTEPTLIDVSFTVKQAYCPDSPDGEITVSATGGVVAGDYLYRWADGATGPVRTNILKGLYKVYVTDANQCTVADSVLMEPLNETCLDIPNAISPNYDNINDVWNIGMKELYPQMEIKIFNRWGEEIWRSEKGYPDPWDGTSNGVKLPIDSYHYIIDLHNGSKPVVGNITILR